MIDRPLRLLPLLSLFASACVAPPPPAPPVPPPRVAVPVVAPPPAAPKTTDWRDIPLTPGDWRYGQEASGSAASFGRVGATPDFVVRCNKAARTIMLVRTASIVTPATMAITTSAGDRAFAVAAVPGSPPALTVSLPS